MGSVRVFRMKQTNKKNTNARSSKKLAKAMRDNLADRGISREWMKKHLIIISGK